MSTPRKHHYLPQFYLEGFKIEPQKGAKPHIWQIERKGDAHYSPAIEDTGCIRDYHSLDFSNEEPDHKTMEALLSRVESEQATAIRNLRVTKSVEAFQVKRLSEFISLMRYRVPAFADHVEASLRAVVLDTFKIMYQAGKFGAPPKKLLDLFEREGIDSALKINISNWKILSHMLQIGLSEESVNLLAQLSYQVYLAEGSDFFVMSDNPVALFHPSYDEIRPYGVGLATRGVELTLPLSSNMLIRAGRDLK